MRIVSAWVFFLAYLFLSAIMSVLIVLGIEKLEGTSDKPRRDNPVVSNGKQRPSQQTFADFIYAVVVGVAFSSINLFDAPTALFSTFFLLFVVLEDFFLYQTEVKPYTDVFHFTSFSSLLFEVSILLCWFLSYLTRSKSANVSFAFFGLFFLMKWLASVKHLGSTKKTWVIHRDHLFLICVLIATILVAIDIPYVVSGIGVSAEWVILAGLWLGQTLLWWRVARSFNERPEPNS